MLKKKVILARLSKTNDDMNDPDYIATSVSRESSSEEREEQEVRAEQELQEEETENRKGKKKPTNVEKQN